ncbi:hypothetical protein PILCRDRAFT_91002 [Piloderma croceum F 1598]|uniref:Uncharacterized protein n=1 Tax=Piloderma croceum (strain F 1598) TaxID=765440 RepID=A0A0C3FCY9_PILCF|nr:hypothetical protein PILCRDRAFT_91002 [Piloderma croceum F 1598]
MRFQKKSISQAKVLVDCQAGLWNTIWLGPGTHDIELERLDLEADFELTDKDSDSDQDDTEYMTADLDQCQDEGEEIKSESDSPFATKKKFTHSEMLDKDNGDESPGQKDIFKIISQCLKDAQKLRSGCTIKILMQFTAVSEYVKL